MSTWYVSTTGSSGNTGAIGSPWSLTYAFAGAGGQIVAGDLVYIRGGSYQAVAGYSATCSGTIGNPVTFKAYTGETPVIDGAYQGLAWEVVDAGLKTWRTTTATFTGVQYGHVQVGATWYPLATFESQTSLSSTSQYYSSSVVFYPGPGVYAGVISGRIHLRLEAVAAGINGARPFAALGSTDPTALTLKLCGATNGITVTGDYLTFDGLTVNDYEALFYSPSAAASIGNTVQNCTGRCGYFVFRLQTTVGWTIQDNTFDGLMYHDDWWVWASDIKGTLTVCDNNRKCVFDISSDDDMTVTRNTFSNFFDGIIDSGSVVDGATVTYNFFDNIWDDAWQLTMRVSRANIGWNTFYGAGVSHDATGTGVANLYPATIYYHDNLIVTATALTGQYFASDRASSASVAAIINECIPISIHGGPTGYSGPWKIYQNTFVFDNPRSGGYLNLGLYGSDQAASHYTNAPHQVMNNLIVCIAEGGRAWDGYFYSATGREIYDGNATSGWVAPSGFYRFIVTSTGTLDQTNPAVTTLFTTFAGMRTTQALADSQVYYAPGWEASGINVADADLDVQYRPRTAAVLTGAVNLTATGWPGTGTYKAWRGAVNPYGANAYTVTVTVT